MGWLMRDGVLNRFGGSNKQWQQRTAENADAMAHTVVKVVTNNLHIAVVATVTRDVVTYKKCGS